MNFEGHPEAVAEVREAAAWYEDQRRGLGLEFLTALDEAVALLRGFPQLGHRVMLDGSSSEFRSLRLNRFPYCIIYVPGDPLYVIAVAHMKRRPDYWHRRVGRSD